VALRTGGNTFYLLNDHLTSTAITTNSSGVRQTELRYFAYGGTRYDAGGQMTLYRYTGQRVETGTGLYDYGARWYDPAIGRFLAADSIVPNLWPTATTCSVLLRTPTSWSRRQARLTKQPRSSGRLKMLGSWRAGRKTSQGQATAHQLHPLQRLPTLHLEASTRCEIRSMTACNMSVALAI
jgi:RHS repeat-associated protein